MHLRKVIRKLSCLLIRFCVSDQNTPKISRVIILPMVLFVQWVIFYDNTGVNNQGSVLIFLSFYTQKKCTLNNLILNNKNIHRERKLCYSKLWKHCLRITSKVSQCMVRINLSVTYYIFRKCFKFYPTPPRREWCNTRANFSCVVLLFWIHFSFSWTK